MIKAKWIGAAALGLRLMHLKPIVRRGIQRRLEKQADELVDDMRETVEVDKGNLRDSIRREPGSGYPGVKVLAGGTPETTKQGPGYTVDEALIVEYGTAKREPEPFFWPAVRASSRKTRKNITEAADAAAQE